MKPVSTRLKKLMKRLIHFHLPPRFIEGSLLMTGRKSLQVMPLLACLCWLALTGSALAQTPSHAIHEVEVTLKARGDQVAGVRVRLVRRSRMQPISETISGQGGRIRFSGLLPGEYIVETFESERFEATATGVTVLNAELRRPWPTRVPVTVELPARQSPALAPPGVLMADVDIKVPEAALKHYRKGAEALRSGDPDEAVKQWRAALAVYPQFYSARLDLGRELRSQKRFSEAAEVLKPLGEIAPKRAEPRIEYAIVLLSMKRAGEAADQLSRALAIEEANWVIHLHLGWALLADEPQKAEKHFKRALELEEQKAAQAHLSLARLAHERGDRKESIRHLEAYLSLAPNAPDSNAVRKLLGQLRR
jgi:tetratricopeptide (TPR) repeat protein